MTRMTALYEKSETDRSKKDGHIYYNTLSPKDDPMLVVCMGDSEGRIFTGKVIRSGPNGKMKVGDVSNRFMNQAYVPFEGTITCFPI